MSEYIENLKILEHLFDVFNDRYYGGELPRSVLTIYPGKPGSAGHFTTWKAWHSVSNPSDGYFEINISPSYLDLPFESVCDTVLHEMAHLFASVNNLKDTSRGGTYHNAVYKRIAEEHGLSVALDPKYGWASTSLAPETRSFVSSLSSVFTLVRREPVKLSTGRRSNSRKYVCPVCGCSVRATKEVHIRCEDCDEIMKFEDSGEA